MKFRSQIEIRATLKQFVFKKGRQEVILPTFVFITEEGKISAVGKFPDGTSGLEKIDLFRPESEHTSVYLEAFIRYGIYRILNSFQLFAPIVTVTLDSGIQSRLKGTALNIFTLGCLRAGAGKIYLKLEGQPDNGGEPMHPPRD